MAIEWAKKRHGYTRTVNKSGDVLFSTTSDKSGRIRATFSFRSGSEKKITSSAYMRVGLQGGMVYFTGGDEDDGLKLNQAGPGQDFRISTADERLARLATKCKGPYDLEYDRSEGLYYIALMKREANK